MVGTFRAQPRVISSDDYKKSGQNLAELTKSYPGPLAVITRDQLGQSLRKEVVDLLEKAELSNLLVSLNVYIGDSGKIDLVIYQAMGEVEDRKQIQQVLDAKLPSRLESWKLNGTK
jgi:hypothetical protein